MDLSDTIDQMTRDLSTTPIQEHLQSQTNDVSMHSPSADSSSDEDEKLTPAQKNLRSSILSIQGDSSLSALDKARKIQATQDANSSDFALPDPVSIVNTTKQRVADDLVAVPMINGGEAKVSSAEASKTFHDPVNEVLGCNHYIRSCKSNAPCCGSWHTCRFCHDDAENHQIDRFKVSEMMCMECQTVQPVAQDCRKCGTRMGNYYCDKCHLWDSNSERSVYHCDKCGICRVGKGLGIDYFHCDKCNVCLAMHLKNNHRCIERNLDSDCPICGEYMFTSTHTVIFMPCGHSIHWKCYQEHINSSYQCPICWKSLANMSTYFQQIDKMLEEHRMPAEYEHFWSLVFCNDCEKKSKTKYHFLYHKCRECGSYNTKILNTVQERPLESGTNASAAEMEMVSELTENGSIRPRSSSNMSTSSSFIPDDNEARNR